MLDLLAEIRADQRAQWEAGRRVSVQALLARHPALEQDEDAAIDLIYGEILLREELGEAVDWDQYRREFPQFAEPLRRQQTFHAIVGGLALPDVRATTPVGKADRAENDTVEEPPGGAPAFPAVPGYEIQQVLGEGSHGIVFLARQLSLGKLVALKMLRDPGFGRPEERQLLRRDAEALAKLDHPNIVRIIDFGESGGRAFYSMEYVKGQSLEERLKSGPLAPREAARLVETLARALHEVHKQQIVHRDLKPANILLCEDGTPKVADFGLAKHLGGDASLAASGHLVGNIAHMAPEQTEGNTRAVGPAADVWALGVILYESLTGRLPFRGKTLVDTMEQIRHREPAPLRCPGVNRDLEAICLKCLEKKAALRFASTAELADELTRSVRQDPRDPVRTRKRAWPIQGWRMARRHPFRAAAIALSATTLLAVPTLRFVTDPDRPIAILESRLSSGEMVTPIRNEGWPTWRRMRAGAETSQVSLSQDGTFAVHSWGLCLLELIRDPQSERYEISAEVRQENGRLPGEVGIFFGLQEIESQRGIVLTYGQLAFNDIDSELENWKRNVPIAPQSSPPKGNEVHFRPNIYGRLSDPADDESLNGAPPVCYFPPGGLHADPKEWRRIVVTVTPEKVRSSWNGMLAGESPTSDWDNQLNSALALDCQVSATRPICLSLRGAIGLYVSKCTASFRMVTVKPLGN